MTRFEVARRIYTHRFGEIERTRDITTLRGMEGGRIKHAYEIAAQKYGVSWKGRRYDRTAPDSADLANQALNHAAPVMQAAASIAVAATGTIPQLGFMHEDSGQSFVLDISDLRRHDVMLDIAFGAVPDAEREHAPIDRVVRRRAARLFLSEKVILGMIDTIKSVLSEGSDDATFVIVTRDVKSQYRGFLGSAMLELAPGVYAHPRMRAGVRNRIWTFLTEWHGQLRHDMVRNVRRRRTRCPVPR